MKCSVENCECKTYARGLCRKHHTQLLRGNIPGSRTMFDKNEIIKYDDHAEIILYDKYGAEVSRVLIDIEDIDVVSKFKWHRDKDGYAVTSQKIGSKVKHIYLHRMLMNADSNELVDHYDRNKQNCRKYNLRIATHTVNSRNVGIRTNNTSGHTGIVWNKNAWNVFITANGKKIYVGRSKDKDIAIQMRKDAEKTYWKTNN